MSWRRTVDRATVLCVAFVMAIQLAVCLAALNAARGAWPAVDLTRVLVVAGADLALLIGYVLRSRHPARAGRAVTVWWPCGLSVVALVAATGIAAPSPLPVAALQIVPVNSVQALQFAVLAAGLAVRWRALAILASGPLYVVLRGTAIGWGGLDALDEWVLPTVSSLAVLAILEHLRNGADAADRLSEAAHEAASAAASRSNAELARDEARRVLHDDVISALRAADLELSPQQVRDASASALASLAGRRPVATVQELERDLRRAASLDLSVDVSEWVEPPPPRVLAALRDAAAEALRNAVRHGAARHAEVRLLSTGVRTEVEVTDAGSGLAPGWQMGFGMRESILGRLADVGGLAEVEPARDGGTTVRLTWPAPAVVQAGTAAPVVRDRTPAAVAVAVACSSGAVYTGLRFPGEHPLLGLAVVAGVLLAVALGAIRVSRSHGPAGSMRPRELWLATLGLCALVWLGLMVAGDGALLSIRSWVIGSTANVMALLAFDVTVRRLLPMLGALVATVLLFAVRDPSLGVADPLGALATPIVVVGMAALLGVALRHGERLIARGQAALAVQAETDAWERTAAQARHRHLTHLEDDVVPYLKQAVATGEADPGDARLLAARCRDELYLARPLDPTTRAAVQDARRRGVTVTLRPGDHDPDAAWPALRAVLAATRSDAVVTVLPRGEQRTGRIVVSPPLDPASLDLPGRHDAVRSTYVLSPEATTPLLERATVGMGS